LALLDQRKWQLGLGHHRYAEWKEIPENRSRWSRTEQPPESAALQIGLDTRNTQSPALLEPEPAQDTAPVFLTIQELSLERDIGR